MDSLKKPTNLSKLKKGKQQPLKVVYISSPMKVKTSASKFRALVQELTGCDSDMDKFYSSEGEAVAVADEQGICQPPAATLAHDIGESGRYQQPFELLEDVVAPHHVVEDFSEFMSSNSLCYEPPRQDSHTGESEFW